MSHSLRLRWIVMTGYFVCGKCASEVVAFCSRIGMRFCRQRKMISSHAYANSGLERLDHRDWLAPNEVLKIFGQVKDVDQLLPALRRLSIRKDYMPSEALYMVVIDKLAYAKRFHEVEILLERIKDEKCKVSDEFFYKVIKIYVNVANHPERAIETMLAMPEYHCWPTVKILNLVLNMLVYSKHYEIIHDVYLSASRLGVVADTCCFNILIKGLCNYGKLDAAFSLLDEMPKQRCKPNATTCATLMHALCKLDRVSEALELCEKMEGDGVYPDTISFNVLISGLCRQGKLDEGMDLLKKMRRKGCYPNPGTYQALLYGLLNVGKFVEAKDFMAQMIVQRAYPSFVSYKSVIDGLCDKNLLDDVETVLTQMVSQGFVPRMGTWQKILRSMFSKTPHCKLGYSTRRIR